MPRALPPEPPSARRSWLPLAGAALALLAVVALLLCSGQRISGPLGAWVEEQTGLAFSCAGVEFSPLYPNTLRLHGVRLGGMRAEDAYLEFDPLAALFAGDLRIHELYLSNVTPRSEDLAALSKRLSERGGMRLDRLRIERSDLELLGIDARGTTLELQGLRLREGRLRPRSGRVSISEIAGTPADLEPYQLRAAEAEFRFSGADDALLDLQRISLRALGGTLTGRGTYSFRDRTLSLSEGYISRMTLNLAEQPLPDDLTLRIRRLELAGAGLAFGQQAAEELSGTIENLVYAEGQVSEGTFEGRFGELTELGGDLSLSDGTLTLTFSPATTRFEVDARLPEGTLRAGGYRIRARQHLHLETLHLEGGHLELTGELLEALRTRGLFDSTSIASLELRDLSLQSRLEEWPLQAGQLDLTAEDLSFRGGVPNTDRPAVMHLQARDLAWRDLRMRSATARIGLAPALVSVELPRLEFQSSALRADLTFPRGDGPGGLHLQARDFELGNLSSQSLGHMFSGKVTVSADLQHQGGDWHHQLQGTVQLSAPQVLISDLGLDLINGGDLQTHTLSPGELLEALRHGDAGVYNLSLTAAADRRQLTVEGSCELASSQVRGRLILDLDTLQTAGEISLESPTHDSLTHLRPEGRLPEMRIVLEPVRRGRRRPGLFDAAADGRDAAPAEAAPAEQP